MRFSKSGKTGFSSKPKVIFRLIVLMCGVVAGCRGSQTIWSGEARSPNGKMLASARTVAQSGFGTGYIGTIVYLNWTRGSQAPMEILGLSDGTEAPGATSVEMKWLDATHLQLSYRNARTLDFQAVKCNGVDISVRELSSGVSSSP